MQPKQNAVRSRLRLLLFLLLLPLCQCAPGAPPAPPPPSAGQGAGLPRLELIWPGTVIGDRAPRGWTHLVLKSRPRLPEAERRLVGDTTAYYATLLFTATVAAVEAVPQGGAWRYRLARVGVGVGTNVRGLDTIISPETQRGLGADLSFIGRQVLSGFYDKEKEIRLVAASPTGAVIDTPAFMPRGRGHAAVVIRYAFLVDPGTGRLDTLVWRIDRDAGGNYEGVVGPVEWLPPNKMVDAVLQVDPNEFRLGVPSERAFAVTRIPEGQRQLALPDGLRAAAAAPRLSAEDARRLDAGLRELIRQAGVQHPGR